MDEGDAEAAEILADGLQVDAEVRRALDITIAPDVLDRVEASLARQRARAAAFFDVALAGSVGASCLRYPEGGHYRRHRDRDPRFDSDTDVRLVTVVVWLNTADEGTTKGAFGGGSLCVDDSGGRTHQIVPVAGTLVAFPADWPHEVMPVTRGTRDVVVDWWL